MAIYLEERFRDSYADWTSIHATPAPYGGAYNDVVRARIVRQCLGDMGLGTRKQDRSITTVMYEGERLSVSTDQVLAFLGLNRGTHRTLRSRAERWCGTKIWMDRNPTKWNPAPTSEHAQLYATLSVMFRPTRLRSPVITGGVLPDPVEHDAATIMTRQFERRWERFALEVELPPKKELTGAATLVA